LKKRKENITVEINPKIADNEPILIWWILKRKTFEAIKGNPQINNGIR